MNRFGSALAEHYSKKIIIAVAMVALVLAFGHWFYSNNEPERVTNISQDVDSVTINGDTTSNLYILEDTSTGMVWIGIPGINRINK